jgi:membrane-bound metal-dependent hydrolase YbcI (DUF457 family)
MTYWSKLLIFSASFLILKLFNLDATQILRPFSSTSRIVLVFPYKENYKFWKWILCFRLPVVKVQLTLANRLRLIRMSDNPDRNMKNITFSSQMSTWDL